MAAWPEIKLQNAVVSALVLSHIPALTADINSIGNYYGFNTSVTALSSGGCFCAWFVVYWCFCWYSRILSQPSAQLSEFQRCEYMLLQRPWRTDATDTVLGH